MGDIAFGSHYVGGPHARMFEVFGYAPDKRMWMLIGSPTGQYIQFDDWPSFAEEREATSAALKAPVWDGTWLADTYGLRMVPLPELWRTLEFDPAMVDQMLEALEPYMPDSNGRRDQ